MPKHYFGRYHIRLCMDIVRFARSHMSEESYTEYVSDCAMKLALENSRFDAVRFKTGCMEAPTNPRDIAYYAKREEE